MGVSRWDCKLESCLSILATRVQMGQMSTETAYLLVSKGYANLVGFSNPGKVQICYFPDPVCARLAMAMMDENWFMKLKGCYIMESPKTGGYSRPRIRFPVGCANQIRAMLEYFSQRCTFYFVVTFSEAKLTPHTGISLFPLLVGCPI
jgi:hypothetical protein